jgi:hypothetical protein
MAKFWYRYGLPFVILIVTGLLVRLEQIFLSGTVETTICSVTMILGAFAFGISLNRQRRRRNESWLKKIVISFLLVYFLLMDLGIVLLPSIMEFFQMIGISGSLLNLLIVYLGYCFFD